MSYLVRMPLEQGGGGVVLVDALQEEVVADHSLEPTGPGQPAAAVDNPLDQSLATLIASVGAAAASAARDQAEVSIEFGLRVGGGEHGVVLARGSVDAHLKVTVTSRATESDTGPQAWRRPAGRGRLGRWPLRR